jgi:hypothetical protein
MQHVNFGGPVLQSFPGSPVLPVLFCQSYSACSVLPVLDCLSCSAVQFCLSCSACLVQPVSFCLLSSDRPRFCSVLPVLFCLFFLSCFVHPYVDVPIYQYCCTCHVLSVFSACPVLPVHVCLNCSVNRIIYCLSLFH